jgi:oligoendopeptidase F
MAYKTNWNLARYFYAGLDDPKLIDDIAQILPKTRAFHDSYAKRFWGFTEPEEIISFYADYSALSHDIATPSYYLFYRSSLDTQDLDVMKKMGEIEYISTEASNLLLFISQGWKDIWYDRIMKWYMDPKACKI